MGAFVDKRCSYPTVSFAMFPGGDACVSGESPCTGSNANMGLAWRGRECVAACRPSYSGARPVTLVIKTGASPSLTHPRSIDRAITAAIAIDKHVSAPLPHSLLIASRLLQRVVSAARARLNRRMGICQKLGGHTFCQAVFWFGPFEFCNSVAEQGDRVIHQLSDQASSLKGQLQ